MLIRKGGIYREIDEKNLQTYKDRGYEVEERTAETPAPAPKAGAKDGSAGK